MSPHRILCMLVCPGSKNCERICAKGIPLVLPALLFLVFCLLCYPRIAGAALRTGGTRFLLGHSTRMGRAITLRTLVSTKPEPALAPSLHGGGGVAARVLLPACC